MLLQETNESKSEFIPDLTHIATFENCHQEWEQRSFAAPYTTHFNLIDYKDLWRLCFPNPFQVPFTIHLLIIFEET